MQRNTVHGTACVTHDKLHYKGSSVLEFYPLFV